MWVIFRSSHLRRAKLLKKRLWYRCFLMNFAKFLRTPCFVEHLRWILLNFFKSCFPLKEQVFLLGSRWFKKLLTFRENLFPVSKWIISVQFTVQIKMFFFANSNKAVLSFSDVTICPLLFESKLVFYNQCEWGFCMCGV